MRYRRYYVDQMPDSSTRVVSTGPVVAWWVFLGKLIVFGWPMIFHVLIGGWIGWTLFGIGEFAWCVWLLARYSVGTESR